MSGADVLLVSHGDVLQILQTYTGGTDPRLHRQLPHLNTGEVRQLATAGGPRPVPPSISSLPPPHSTAHYFPSLWSSGSTSRKTSPASSPLPFRRRGDDSQVVSPPRPAVTPVMEESRESVSSSLYGAVMGDNNGSLQEGAGGGDDPWWPPLWAWMVASVVLAGAIMALRHRFSSTSLARPARVTFIQ